jgi:FixJ family two-component response regulator
MGLCSLAPAALSSVLARVAADLRRAGVTVPVILISGTPGMVEEGFFRVLRKPFDLRALADAVEAAVTHRRGSSA